MPQIPKEKMMPSAERFKRMRQHLNVTQVELGKVIGVSNVTIKNWEKTYPKFDDNTMRELILIGVNPLYCFGYGSINLPEASFEQLCDNLRAKVQSALNKPESEEVEE